ncbi:glycosyltransferase [Paenibacillus sp. P96]|uniref:Glycosyltransferase n=1 Tax=Paenibacillus zeirhizosphaerae TaxID=2987519 RepID=A0ABT9FXB3_9BACL|nr:glycosyltransferase [Paenibacillus sp. P96]MDP4099368.1 glycosyltransferase [Paenibacillus sp. P96]
MDQPSISLCMIVRNEEKNLPRCLSSVQPIVDEIIIVDTGSTDDTIAIAKTFGAKVIQMPWQDSFSDARNRGLDEATGDWILWLDADEELDVNGANKLKELLTRDAIREQGIEGLQFILCSHLERGMECLVLHRMVRNRPQYRFEGRVHEQIMPSMLRFKPNLILAQVDIHIHHYGYLSQNATRQEKAQRNISLLLQAMAEHPDYPIYPYYLGIELCRIQSFEEALNHFNAFLNRSPGLPKPLVASAHKYRLLALAEMKRYSDLIRHSIESIALYPGFTDLYHLMALGCRATGESDKAIQLLRKALSTGPAEEYPTIAGYGTFLTCLELGSAYSTAENPQETDLYFTLASLMVGNAGVRFREKANASSGLS